MSGHSHLSPSSRRLRLLFPFLGWLPLLDGETVRNDILAGITAGVLILPQAIALATVAGLPPEYGLYTSIFPVVIAALFGSSRHSLSGPNTALAVLTAASIAPFANIGTVDYIQYAVTLTFMTGALQLLLGVLHLGVLFVYFSQTVMVALVTGVGTIIIVQQIGNFLGVVMNPNEALDDTLFQILYMLPHANPYAVAAGLVTLAVGVAVHRLRPRWPHYILAVVAGMLTAQLFAILVGSATAHIDMVGYLGMSLLPLSAPDFSPQNFAEFSIAAYPAAISMAFLGLMQSAVIARSLAAKSGQQGVSINQETIGQGLGNVAGSFLSCFPSCGSFNRSAANLEAGAHTPLAGLVSAAALALLILVAAPIIAWLPIPVMAAILFMVGASLVKIRDIRKLMAMPGEKRIVFGLVLAVTLFDGVSNGLFFGVAASLVLHLRSIARPDVEILFNQQKVQYLEPGMEPDHTTAIAISGNLFFGSTQALAESLADVAAQDRSEAHLMIVGDYIQNIDTAAAEILVQEAKKRAQRGYRTVLRLRMTAMATSRGREALEEGLGRENIHLEGPARGGGGAAPAHP